MEVQFLTELIEILKPFGYLGAFAMSVIGSATIILPVPYFFAIAALATTLNPILLTIVAGIGSAIGEFVAFFVGRVGHKFIIKKHGKWITLAEKWFKKHGFLSIVFLAFLPAIADIGGIVAGAFHYNKWRFLLANIIGKTAKFAIIVYAGYFSLPEILKWIGAS
jgi:membrane protein DedA with SNARE-associated domain